VALLSLTNGMVTTVDESDLASLSRHRWYAHERGPGAMYGFYAYTQAEGRKVYLHRLLLSAPPHLHVDHINRDGLDNRRANLRLAWPSQNRSNTKASTKIVELLGLKGINRHKNGWRARVFTPERIVSAPTRSSPWEAAFDYDRLVQGEYGEFSSPNFPLCGLANRRKAEAA
jgi:hypothetical protein